MKRSIIILVVVCLVLAAAYGLKEYHRTPEDVSRRQAVAEMSVPEVIRAFEKEPVQSSRRYIDKVITVKGTVTGVQAEDQPVVLTLGEKGIMSSVQCSMDSAYTTAGNIVVGSSVSVKGVCTGAISQELFGTDVKLSRCILEKQ